MKVREIPIIHKNGQPVRSHTAPFSCQRTTPARHIPIQRESSGMEQFHPATGSSQSRVAPPYHSTRVPLVSGHNPTLQGTRDVLNGRSSPSCGANSADGVPRGYSPQVVADGVRKTQPMEQADFAKAREIPIVYEPPVQISQTNADTESDDHDSSADVSTHQNQNEDSQSLQVEPPAKRSRSPSPSAQTLSSLDLIEQILSEASSLRSDVEKFTGRRGEKQYLVLEEMLTRLLIKLDVIDSQGIEDVRNARREAVRKVQSSLDLLELKGKTNSSAVAVKSEDSSQPMDCSATTAESPEKPGDVEQQMDDVDVRQELPETASDSDVATDDALRDPAAASDTCSN
jgi:BAG domain